MQFIRDALPQHGDRLEFAVFEGLLVDFCRSRGATVIVRGLRALADFEYEFQFAHMNRRLAPGVDTVFFMTDERNHYVSLVAGQGGRQPRRRRHRPRARCRSSRRSAAKYQEVKPCRPRSSSRRASIRSSRRSPSRSPRRPPSSRPRASTSSASAPASPTSTRPRTSRTPRAPRSTSGVGKYTDVGGILPLRKAIAAELGARPQHRRSSPSRSSSRRGAKHSLYNLFMALLDPGDEVLIPAPYWVSYPDMVMLAGGRPVILETTAEDDFAVTADAGRRRVLAAHARDRAQQPVEPDRRRLHARADRGARGGRRREGPARHLRRHLPPARLRRRASTSRSRRSAPEVAKRTILVDGVSKTYAMTGWRIGYTAGPLPLIKAMAKIQGQSTSNPTHIAQVAALAALTGPQDCVADDAQGVRRAPPRDGEAAARDPRRRRAASRRARSTRSPTSRRSSARRRPRARSSTTTSSSATGSSRSARSRSCPARASARPASSACRTRARWTNIQDGVGRLAKALGTLR